MFSFTFANIFKRTVWNVDPESVSVTDTKTTKFSVNVPLTEINLELLDSSSRKSFNETVPLTETSQQLIDSSSMKLEHRRQILTEYDLIPLDYEDCKSKRLKGGLGKITIF